MLVMAFPERVGKIGEELRRNGAAADALAEAFPPARARF
jgi:hypothetical protein